jgi:LacI family transcriptional regulator
MEPSKPSLRSLARTLGLSHTTVSDALRGTGRVDRRTVERVRKAAHETGYQHNPLASNLMSEMRRSRGGTFRGLIAAVSHHEPEQPALGLSFPRELLVGARIRAQELGFALEEFVVGQAGLTLPRLNSVLQARGIHGVIILPQWNTPDWSKLEWRNFAGIYADHAIERPALHCVCCDHYRSMMNALSRLASMGYKRPGLLLLAQQDDRIMNRFSAAFNGFKTIRAKVPPLLSARLQREEFVAWFRKYDPDVVIAHYTSVIDWMKECGAQVPATHGFLCLNHLYKMVPCAGLDLQPREIGARSAEFVIAQLQRNDRGVPVWPSMTAIPARWIDGPTLCEPSAKAAG